MDYPGFIRNGGQESLYREASIPAAGADTATTLGLIPYYAWNNRTPAPMQVWISYEKA